MKPPIIIEKRPVRPTAQELRQKEIDRRRESAIKVELRKAALEAKPPLHPLEEECAQSPYEYALRVLTKAGILHYLKGHAFIGNRPATPRLAVEEANRILKINDLPQIPIRHCMT